MPNPNHYMLGNVIRLTATFTVSSVATDPSPTPVCTVKLPDETTSTPSVTRTATGIYTADFTSTQAGKHSYRWAGEGSAKAAAEGSFYIDDSDVI